MHEQEPQPSERIGITYSGIMAEKMDWDRITLGRFEQAADLKTAVEITNSSTREEFDIVSLGDTLAIRKTVNIQDLATKRKAPESFLSIDTNLQTGKAVIRIDDQMLASRSTKDKRFSQAEFIQKIEKVTKKGLNSVLATEKKHQIAISLKLASIIPVSMTPLVPGAVIMFENLGRNQEVGTVVGLVLYLAGRQAIQLMDPLFEKFFMEKVSDSEEIYFPDDKGILNSPKHMLDWNRGRRFLQTKEHTIVEPKA